MIDLYILPSAWGTPSISPFCTKLETYLRMRGLPYRTRFGDPRRAPKGKVPYLDWEGRRIADSQFAIDALEAHADGEPLDGWLSPAQRAEAHFVRRALEEGLYFVAVHARWFDPASWRAYEPVFLPYLPPLVGRVALALARRDLRAALRAQGTGRHTDAEIYALGRRDLDALAQLLGDRAFALGERPSTLDATVFAFLAAVHEFPVATPLADALRAHANLTAYHARMRARYYAGWTATVRDGQRG